MTQKKLHNDRLDPNLPEGVRTHQAGCLDLLRPGHKSGMPYDELFINPMAQSLHCKVQFKFKKNSMTVDKH